ncbi:MAG: iron-containing alcohol dehydrogenase, partial [Oscillospiraceae bacterium]|nr:iron-containing alcohol dehydrogenase [Oscillospiraceae bacterium]
HLLVNGICDIMSHHTDRYMTDDAHFGIFDNLLESAMHYLHTELAPVILDPERDNLTDRTELMAVADMGVNEFIAWGRNKENASHQLAHPIGAVFDTIHGSTLTIVYSAWLPYVYKDNAARVARWAEKVWDVEPDAEHPEKVAEEGIRRLKQWYVSLGMPTKFSDIGLHPTEEQIEHMASAAANSLGKGYIGVIRKLYKEDIVKIYKMAL